MRPDALPQVLLAAVLLAAVLLVGCSPSEDPAERAREDARRALVAGDRSAMLGALNELRASQPDTPEAILELSALLVQAGEAPQVVWLLESGVKRFPQRDDLRLALGRVALLVGNASLARSVVERIATDSEHYLASSLVLAEAELGLGELERALRILEEAERLHPDSPDARLARIATLLRERRYDDARAALDEAKASFHPEKDAQTLRGVETIMARIQAAQGDVNGAISRLEVLVEADPTNVRAWQPLLDLLWKEGRGEEALALLGAALASDSDLVVLYALSAPLYMSLGRAEEAEQALREFAGRSESPSGYVRLAQFYADRQEGDRAAELHREAIERFPSEPMLRALHAETLIGLNRVDEALAELARFREQAPNNPRVDYLEARIELAEGAARRAATRLQELMPELDRPATQFWLGRALEAMEDYEGAERRYGLARRRNPAWAAPTMALIRLAQRRGDWRGVATYARPLVRREPGWFDAWVALVDALTKLGEAESAEVSAKRFAAAFPERLEPPLLLARAWSAQGRHADALRQVAEVADRFGPRPEIEARRVWTLGLAGRVDEGIRVAREATVVHSDSARLHQALAELLFANGAADEGALAVDRALELDPEDPTPLRTRCEFRAATGRLDGARSDCERYLRIRPDDPEAHYVLGAVHAEAERIPEAIASYQRAAALDDRAFAPRNNLAELLAAQGDLDGALAVAQEAYAIASDDPNVLDTLGSLYLRTGLVERAISLLEEARSRAPDLSDGPLELALAERGRTEEARALPVAPASAELAERLAALESPNFVLIVVDALRADWTTPYGYGVDTTPELARWADRGVLFARVRSQSSWTKISMASLLTSLWPRTHAIRESQDGLASEALTLAEVFLEAGYRTYAVQTNGWLDQSFGFHQGFDRYMFPRGRGARRLERPSVWPHADRVVEEATRLIDAHDSEQPFLLYLHFMDVHQYAAPPEYKHFGTGNRGAYLAAIRWVDDAVARVRTKLADAGALDRTVMVFAADHGEAFGENGQYGHARNVLTSVLWVPLVIRFPFRLRPIRVDVQVRNLDIAPTLLDIAGLPIPASFEGRSLLTLVRSGTPESDRASYAGLGQPLFRDAVMQVSLNEGSWSFARNVGSDSHAPEFLFDRTVDPRENVNLIEREPAKAAQMRNRLDRYLERKPADGVLETDVRIDPSIADRLRAMGYLR